MGCEEAKSPQWFDVSPKNSARDMMHEQEYCDEAAHHQLPIAGAFCIIRIVPMGRMFKLNSKFDADSWLYSLSHFECDGYTCSLYGVCLHYWLVKLSLFMHAHSSPLSLAARLHGCGTKCSRYINNGQTFSGQTLYSFKKTDFRSPTSIWILFHKWLVFLPLYKRKVFLQSISNLIMMYSPGI